MLRKVVLVTTTTNTRGASSRAENAIKRTNKSVGGARSYSPFTEEEIERLRVRKRGEIGKMSDDDERQRDDGNFSGEITKESVSHKRYLAVYDREVTFRTKKFGERVIKYDIVGHPRAGFKFVCVLPFHSLEKEFTLCREYVQSTNRSGVCAPTGGHEREKHGRDVKNAATAEMSEEAKLKGGELVNLMRSKRRGDDSSRTHNKRSNEEEEEEEEEGFIETKWCRNKFVPFLCVDPVEDKDADPLDHEEFALETFRVNVQELRTLMYSGEMMLPSIITCQMSLNYLARSGLLTLDEIL